MSEEIKKRLFKEESFEFQKNCMDHNHINWNALVNYVRGQCSSVEEEIIGEWIKMDPKNEEFIEFLKKIWETSAEEKTSWDVDDAWSRFNAEYEVADSKEEWMEAQSEPVTKKRVQKNPKRTKQWYSWAAVLAAVAIIFTIIYSMDLPLNNTELAVQEQAPVFREIVTKNGQRTHLILSDGSKVIVNAGSRLVLPEIFATDEPREIRLSGEAWFEVEHDPARPFIVYTEDAATTVLGTKFQVRAYPEDEQVEVVVAEGKVALQDNKRMNQVGAAITRNQIGVFSEDGTTTVSRVRNLAPYLGWKDGQLVFDQEPLSEVVQKLQRWYDVDIQTDAAQSEINQKELTASFTENQPISEVLETIALTLEIQYRKADKEFAFYFYK